MENNPDQKHINLTDPDAPLMKGKKRNFDTNYNIQAACGEDEVITFCDITTQGNDKAQLIPSLKGIMENTGKQIEMVLADADYGTYESLEYMDQNNMIGYVPYRNMNTTYEDQPFHASHFVYHQGGDYYVCPSQKHLNYYHTSEHKDRNQFFRKYRTAHKQICKACPFFDQCVPKKLARRIIKRETRQHLKDQMKDRLNNDAGKQMYRKRLHPIEAFFGHIKFNLGYTRFLLRGLHKVKAEFTLICLSYNLRKLITKLACFLIVLKVFYASQHIIKQNQLVIPNMSMNF